MGWKQSKRRSLLHANKGRFGLGFLLEIPFIFKPGTSERASCTRQGTSGERGEGPQSTQWFPLVVAEVHPGAQLPGFRFQLCHYPVM